jgi:hypothetical protein
MDTHLFVGMSERVREAAERLASLGGMTVESANDPRFQEDLTLSSPGTTWRLYRHTLSSEPGLDFERYQLALAGDSDSATAEARRLFERLARLDVPVMLTENLETKLAEFHPKRSAA